MSKGKRRFSVWIIGSAALILVALALISLLTNKTETYIHDELPQKSIAAISCSTNGVDGAFFSSELANTVDNTIKITFSGDKIDKLFYSYNGVYRDDEVAESDEAKLHAKYNIYMGENNIHHNILSPYFSRVGNELQITLYADGFSAISGVTAKLFFIGVDDIDIFKEYSSDQAKDFYEKQGFSCKNS